MAHRELHKLYPQEDPPYSLAQNCTIYVFDKMSLEVVEQIRICGSAQNTFEAARQKMTVWDHLMDARREMIKRRVETGNKHYKLVTSEKVFFFFCTLGFLFFVYFFGFRKSWQTCTVGRFRAWTVCSSSHNKMHLCSAWWHGFS